MPIAVTWINFHVKWNAVSSSIESENMENASSILPLISVAWAMADAVIWQGQIVTSLQKKSRNVKKKNNNSSWRFIIQLEIIWISQTSF